MRAALRSQTKEAMTLVDQLVRDEGMRLHPYTDTRGKMTIGVGRNLTDDGISEPEAEMLLSNDIAIASSRLEEVFPWTNGLDDVRRGALINMTFNMGIGGLAEFRNFLECLKAGDYKLARDQMLDSKWATEVGSRAHRLAIQIETGVWQ